MLKVEYLTPLELEMVDPTGKGRAKLQSYVDSKPTMQPAVTAKMTRDQWADGLTERLAVWRSQRHERAYQWDLQHRAKYGPQGGTFDVSYLKSNLRQFYLLADGVKSYNLAIIGRDYLLRHIDQLIRIYGYPQIMDERGVDGTLGGLPTMKRKGTFVAETVGAKPFRHVTHDLAGERYQRLKRRGIHHDSVLNVRYVERELSAVRRWLRTYLPYFSAWLNPVLELQPAIYRHISGSKPLSIETDFTGCDEHFSLDNALQVVAPVYEVLLKPFGVLSFLTYIEEAFYQPLFWGQEVWTGKHNLFSGQPITNDFETIYDVCVVLGALLVSGVDLSSDRVKILALGDDIAVLLNGYSRKIAERVMDHMIDEFHANGMEISLEKSRLGEGDVRFCRRLYYPGVSRERYNLNGQPYLPGAYPCFLALNSIINPEFFNIGIEQLVANLQRTDNVDGSPFFVPFTQFVYSNLRGEPLASGVDLNEFRPTRDWWDRLYGELWCAADSPSLRVCSDANIMLRYV